MQKLALMVAVLAAMGGRDFDSGVTQHELRVPRETFFPAFLPPLVRSDGNTRKHFGQYLRNSGRGRELKRRAKVRARANA